MIDDISITIESMKHRSVRLRLIGEEVDFAVIVPLPLAKHLVKELAECCSDIEESYGERFGKECAK